jgi:hypothetical protein
MPGHIIEWDLSFIPDDETAFWEPIVDFIADRVGCAGSRVARCENDMALVISQCGTVIEEQVRAILPKVRQDLAEGVPPMFVRRCACTSILLCCLTTIRDLRPMMGAREA